MSSANTNTTNFIANFPNTGMAVGALAVDNTMEPLLLDASGNLKVNVAAGGASGGTSSTFGAAFPGTGTAVGAKDSTGLLMSALNLDASGNLKVAVTGAGSGGTSIVDGSTFTRGTSAETPAGGIAETTAPTLTNGKAGALSLTLAGALRVDASATTQPVSGTFFQATQPISAAALPLPTGAATAAKQPALGTAGSASADVISIQGISSMTPIAVTGTFFQATQPVSGTVTANIGTTNGLALDASVTGLQVAQGSTTAAQKGDLVQGAVTTAAPAYTTAQTSPLSLTTAGALRIDGSATTQPVSGTLTTTPPANASTNVTQWAGTAVDVNSGNKSAGTLRVTLATDQVALTNALKVDGSAVTQPVSGTFWQATQPVSGTVTSNIGTTNGLALDASVTGLQVAQGAAIASVKGNLMQGSVTTAAPTYTTAQVSPLSLTTTGALRVDGSGVTQPVSGTVTTTPPANASTNVAQWAGTAVDVNSGTKSAGTIRVVLATDQPALTNKLLVTPDSVALPANQSVNVSQINAVTPLMGNGVTGTGSQRVTIASDNTAFTVNAAQSGTWTVQPGNTANTTPWLVTDTAATSGGLSFAGGIMPATPAKTVVKGSAGQLYSITAFNSNATPVFLKFWNNVTGSVTLGTTAADFQYMVPGNTGGAGFVINIDKGVALGNGIIFAVTNLISTVDNTAIAANTVIVNAYYK